MHTHAALHSLVSAFLSFLNREKQTNSTATSVHSSQSVPSTFAKSKDPTPPLIPTSGSSHHSFLASCCKFSPFQLFYLHSFLWLLCKWVPFSLVLRAVRSVSELLLVNCTLISGLWFRNSLLLSCYQRKFVEIMDTVRVSRQINQVIRKMTRGSPSL